MDKLKVFENRDYGKINVVIENNKEYFEATKVAEILGYTNPRKAVRDHCDDNGIIKEKVQIISGTKLNGQPLTQRVNKKFIDEANLYRLIMKSQLESAKKFEKWVVEQVLPSIRKNKAYIEQDLLDKMINNPEVIERLLMVLRNEQKKVGTLNKVLKDNEHFINIGKLVGQCDDAISIGAYAKMLNSLGMNIGRNRLFAWFKNNGYLMKQGLENQPVQKYMDMGLFKTRQFIINTSSGQKIVVTTYITGKGQEYFTKIIGEVYRYEKAYRQN